MFTHRLAIAVLMLLAGAATSVGAEEAALSACQTGPGDQRIPACTRAIEAKPRPADEILVRAYTGRCEAKRMVRDYEGALADCSEALKVNPKSAESSYQRALTYRSRNEPDRALPDLNEAIANGSGDRLADYLYGRLVAFQYRNDWDACLLDANAALKIRPKEKTFLNSRGWCHGQKRDFAAAMQDFDALIAIDPKFVPVYYNRGRLNFSRSELNAALADFNAALELSPNYGSAYFSRALVHERQKNLAGAIADIDAAASRLTQDNSVKVAHARIHAAAEGKPQQAQPALQQAQPKSEFAEQSPLSAEAPKRRVALVIGNSAYKFASPLPNPANDSLDVAAALRALDFTVVEGHDLDWRGMIATIKQFAGQLENADVALVFYAGHGIQVNGENYLLPVDAKLETPGSLDLDAVDLRTILRPMEDRKRVNLIFLDACRDNPFTRSIARAGGNATRSVSVSQGLAQVQAAAGTMIAYATQPDNVAQDGRGRNSPFTTALLKYLPKPDLEVEQMMKLVRVDVMGATQQRQVPWGHSSLVGDVYLAPRKR